MKCLNTIILCLTGLFISAAEFTVRVDSGDHPVSNAIVTVPLNRSDVPSYGSLVSSKGTVVFQRNPEGGISFVIPAMDRNEIRRYTYPGNSAETRGEGTEADLNGGKITLRVGEKTVLIYQGRESELPRTDIKPEFKRGGYIHPVFSPSGRLITDDYPPNHVHHHGVWFPWTKTRFEGREPDFWNMGQKKGKVEFAKFGQHWSGPVHAGFQAEHRFIDLSAPSPKIALNESWTVTTYRIPGQKYFVFDLISTQSCASASPLVLPKYHYGGLGFRGNWAWNGEANCSFLTSNGETDRKKGNETRAHWCHIGGEVDGERTGIAILSHPGNFRAPQPMRLHPSEPFFCFAPSQVDDWKIEPGQPYVSRYRFVVSDGPPDKEVIDRMWNAYAHPPKALVEGQ